MNQTHNGTQHLSEAAVLTLVPYKLSQLADESHDLYNSTCQQCMLWFWKLQGVALKNGPRTIVS